MRSLLLLFLTAGLAVGCTSTQQNRYDRYGRAYPASARVDRQGGQDRYRICHKGKDTQTVPASAVRGHLRHGDDFGRCTRRDRRDARRDQQRGRRSDRSRDRRDNYDDDRDDDDQGNRRGRGRQ